MRDLNIFTRVGSAAVFLIFFLSMSWHVKGQSWPVSAGDQQYQIQVYQPSVESYKSNTLSFRAAISVTEKDDNVPLFGSVWGSAKLRNNADGKTVALWNAEIEDVRFPDGITSEEKNRFALLVRNAINNHQPVMAMDDIVNGQISAEKEKSLANQINNTPPRIIYATEATLLVNIDGDPVIQNTDTKGVDMVVNTPFLILKYQNNFYLGNGTLWYRSGSATGNFTPERNVPAVVISTADALKTGDEEAVAETDGDFYPKVLVSTTPAELVQTDGSPSFSAIQGTSLLFVSNTEEQLLLDINSQSYYVLLSGRWYTAKKLDGAWTYVLPGNLPADFSRIPEGSEKDAVLANIPGTTAAQEAVRDAQVPYAAAVDRNTATSEVIYDGTPYFESIQGTDLRMATNSSNTVVVERNNYYLVDNGVWFVSGSPNGPWRVSDYRPAQVVLIPPSSPAYNIKYVEIYHATPDVVYVGYTRGYLSGYVVNRVVVYGTGYRYRPWRGRFFYPRPYTWGFGMVYNPWYGWSINVSYGIGGFGWFAFGYPSYYFPPRYPLHRPGWWGPPVYRPPYRRPYSHYYGSRPARPRPIHYGPGVVQRPTPPRRPVNNIYADRGQYGVVSPTTRPGGSSRPAGGNYNYSQSARPVTRPSATAPSSNRPGTGTSTRPGTGTSTSTRPGSSSSGSSRPGSTVQPSTRPGTSGSQSPSTTRPGTTTRPGSGTQQPSSRPSPSGTQPQTRPSSTRPGSGTGSSQPASRPGSSTPQRPAQNNPSSSRPSTVDRPSSGTRQTPQQNHSTTPSRRQESGSGGRQQ